MATLFRYADFLKTLANTEIHNTTTIVNHGQDIGLLQKRFEEIQEGQLKKNQGVDEAKKSWSKDLVGQLHYPEKKKKKLTIEDVWERSHTAIRGLSSRQSKLFPELPDGLASNGKPGWLSYRWKQALLRLNWTDEEWEVFQRELAEWKEAGEPINPSSPSVNQDSSTEEEASDGGESRDEESGDEEKRGISLKPLVLCLSSLACLGLAVSMCWFENGNSQQEIGRQFAIDKLSIGAFTQPTEAEINLSPSHYISTNLGSTTCPQPPPWNDLSVSWQGSSPAVVATGGRPVLFIAGLP